MRGVGRGFRAPATSLFLSSELSLSRNEPLPSIFAAAAAAAFPIRVECIGGGCAGEKGGTFFLVFRRRRRRHQRLRTFSLPLLLPPFLLLYAGGVTL